MCVEVLAKRFTKNRNGLMKKLIKIIFVLVVVLALVEAEEGECVAVKTYSPI